MRTVQFLKESKRQRFGAEPCGCAYLAQHRVDISEAIKCLAQAMSKPKAGSDDAIATSGEAPQRSFKKSTAVPLARAKQSALGSARGQRLGWRPSNASEQVLSHCAERTTFAQTHLNSTKRDWTQ